MSFPDDQFSDMGAYYLAYAEALSQAIASVDRDAMTRAADILSSAIVSERTVFSCGNGGSAAIANHLVCDHVKGLATDTGLRPRVHSLSSNIELVTALANDVSYAEVFAGQLSYLARPGDVLITISSSGDSDNVVRAVEWARANGLASIAMTGFSGGRTAGLADVNLHVAADNYGIIEDAHQSLMHILAQFIRQSRMSPDLISIRRF